MRWRGDDVVSYPGGALAAGFVDLDGGADTDTVDFSGVVSAVWVDLDYGGNEVWTQDDVDLVGGSWRGLVPSSPMSKTSPVPLSRTT